MKLKSLTKTVVIATFFAAPTLIYATPVRLQMEDYNVGKITIKEKSSGNVVFEKVQEFGESGPYDMDLAAGDYLLECYDVWDDFYRGGLYITIPEESDTYTQAKPYYMCIVGGCYRVDNTNSDGTYFKQGVDYNIDFSVATIDGTKQEVIVGTWIEKNRDYYAVPMPQGNCTVTVTPTDLHTDLLSKTRTDYIVVTGSGATSIKMPTGIPFEVTAPSEASIFIGTKDLHYKAFNEIKPRTSVDNDNSTKTYTYTFSGDQVNYYYRASIPGVITHAGKIVLNDNIRSINLSDIKEDGTPDYYNHDVTANNYANNADIYLNINKQNHLRLNVGDEKSVVAQRIWQLTDDETGNFFVEPDYHFTVYNDKFEACNDVVTVDEEGNLKAIANGTAIVFVDYDACVARKYNTFYGENDVYDYAYGAKWSKLWAENTGLFVVTVGEGNNEGETFDANFVLNTSNEAREDKTLDSELDVLYYHENENGYVYNYNPVGASSVELANPEVDFTNNTVRYAGFTKVSANEDGSYSLLLTYGRNIIRTTSTDGFVAYQVISAKPFGYEVTNESRDDNKILLGDKIAVQFHGFFHPMSKLAAIYNQSASLDFVQANNEGALYQGAGQYTFAGKPQAQLVEVEIDKDFDMSSYVLKNGSIRVKGYGSCGGAHREIDRSVGLSPNMSAAITDEYWGSIPDVSIKIDVDDSGVENITVDNNAISNVYTITGVSLNVKALDTLPKGVYIVRYQNGNSQKIVK